VRACQGENCSDNGEAVLVIVIEEENDVEEAEEEEDMRC